jgi:hypothetical protein
MSDLQLSVVPLNTGLDLTTAKIMAEPGSMLDCLNYELVDQVGYRRIDGFMPYDGSISIKDIPDVRIMSSAVTTSAMAHPTTMTNFWLYTPVSLYPYAWGVEYNSDSTTTGTLTYIPLVGNPELTPAWSMPGPVLFTTAGDITEGALTQQQLVDFENALIDLTSPLPGTAVGLHWHRDYLYAVVPLVVAYYAASNDNQEVGFTPYATLTADGTVTGVLLDKIITQAAGASDPEQGYFIIRPASAANVAEWEGFNGGGIFAYTGAVSVGAGTVQARVEGENMVLTDTNSDVASLWVAWRPGNVSTGEYTGTPGWQEISDSYTVTVTLSGIQDPFNSLALGNTNAESTYYFESTSGNSVRAVVLDYFVTSGAFDTGDAVVELQITKPILDVGTHSLLITTADDMYLETDTTTKLGDVSAQSTYNYLPGIPSLVENSSRYEFLSANFYATEGLDAVYGVNGAGRAFTFGRTDGYFSYIYTQADATRDKPRHVENHALHLALGFKEGSVQLSVVGDPTNFSGDLGASEIGVGDRVTGLMALPGSTLGVFCEQSIWSIVGSTIDAFDTQVILPKTGCIEYSLVNCGQPVFCNSHGITTLSTSANYGDFLGENLSSKISDWLIPRLRRGVENTINTGGIACAVPVRNKNQYRLFFNNGNILTMTIRNQSGPGFTFQKYYLDVDGDEYNETALMIPIAYTSQIDWQGQERIFASHYNQNSPYQTTDVFALESGNGFNGRYIPHYFVINWYFGQSLGTFTTLQGLRAFGLSRGLASLNLQATGPQTDFYFKGNEFSTTPVPLNLPRTNPIGIVSDLQPVTNRADIAARGLALQVRISGSNTDLDLIEPTHAVQVLNLYSTPTGAFDL